MMVIKRLLMSQSDIQDAIRSYYAPLDPPFTVGHIEIGYQPADGGIPETFTAKVEMKGKGDLDAALVRFNEERDRLAKSIARGEAYIKAQEGKAQQ